MITGPDGGGYFLVASDGGIFSFGTAPFYGSLGGQAIKHPIVAAAATPTDNGYWFTDTAGLVSNFGSANYYGSAPRTCSGRSSAWRRRPATAPSSGAPIPRVPTATTSATSSARRFPPATHQIGIVAGGRGIAADHQPVPGLEEAAWAGGGLNLYTYLTYGDLGDGRARMQPVDSRAMPAIRRLMPTDAFNAACRRQPPTAVVARRREPSNSQLVKQHSQNAEFVQGALNALHETEGIANVGIYASPGVWNSIVGNYSPSVPYWMADYLNSPSGPGTCADYPELGQQQAQLPHRPAADRAVQQHAVRRRLRLLARRPPDGAACYEWRAPFENTDLNALHAEGFDHPLLDIDWRTQVERHSLGWVCAFEGAPRRVRQRGLGRRGARLRRSTPWSPATGGTAASAAGCSRRPTGEPGRRLRMAPRRLRGGAARLLLRRLLASRPRRPDSSRCADAVTNAPPTGRATFRRCPATVRGSRTRSTSSGGTHDDRGLLDLSQSSSYQPGIRALPALDPRTVQRGVAGTTS